MCWIFLLQYCVFSVLFRIDRAVCKVYRLAMQDFTDTRLVSSCVAFLEMVDRDSRLLRVDVQAAGRIARHCTSYSPAEAEKLCTYELRIHNLYVMYPANHHHSIPMCIHVCVCVCTVHRLARFFSIDHRSRPVDDTPKITKIG